MDFPMLPNAFRGAYYPGAPLPGSGGSLMGPNHPYFGGGRGGFPYPGGPGVPGSGGFGYDVG